MNLVIVMKKQPLKYLHIIIYSVYIKLNKI